MHLQLILSSCLRVTNDIPGCPQHFERLSGSWVFILVWMDLKGEKKEVSKRFAWLLKNMFAHKKC